MLQILNVFSALLVLSSALELIVSGLVLIKGLQYQNYLKIRNFILCLTYFNTFFIMLYIIIEFFNVSFAQVFFRGIAACTLALQIILLEGALSSSSKVSRLKYFSFEMLSSIICICLSISMII